MQTSLLSGMWQRLAYYVSTVYVGQLREGEEYSELRPAISICVLSEFVFDKSTDLHLDFRFREVAGRVLTDDLQIHLLQLRNLRVPGEELYNSTPAERWAFFLKNADKLSCDEIRHILPEEEFSEAAGVLEMISQTPEQLMLYNARLKYQRDEFARLEQSRLEIEQARLEGEARGEARGMNIGRIAVLRELLGLQTFTAAELADYDDSQLIEIAEQLQGQLRTRRES